MFIRQYLSFLSTAMAKNFKYTKSSSALTEAQREFYEDNGYIVIKNNVPHSLLDELCQHFINVCEEKDGAAVYLVKDRSLKNKNRQGQYVVNKIQDFLHDDEFFKYAIHPAVTEIVESIIGPNFVGAHSMLINKPPDSDPDYSKHPLHQDLHYFPFRPADTIVASWTAMEFVNEENGCLFAIPGSHKEGQLYPHTYPEGTKNALYHGVYAFENEPRVNLVMEKGDTVFFHPLLLHGSGPNRTKGFRKAISVHYADSYSQFINVYGTTQENIAREIEKLLNGGDYISLWKMKSRHVKGDPGTFKILPSSL